MEDKPKKPRKPRKPRLTDAPRKTRADSKLGTRSAEDQARVAEWCAQDTLAAAKERCARELSPPVEISLGQLSCWYTEWNHQQALQARKQTLVQIFQQADANAKAVAEMLREGGASEEQMARANQLVFTLQASAGQDVDLFIDLEKLRMAREAADHKVRMDNARLEQKQTELALAERRVAVLEAKLQEIKDTAGDVTLTDEERARKIAEIYGRI